MKRLKNMMGGRLTARSDKEFERGKIMKLLFVVAGLLPVSANVWAASNIADCILDRMPGAASDVAAGEIAKACGKEWPAGYAGVKKREGWFDFSTGAECVEKKAKSTSSRTGAGYIRGACYALFEPLPPMPTEKQFTAPTATPPSPALPTVDRFDPATARLDEDQSTTPRRKNRFDKISGAGYRPNANSPE